MLDKILHEARELPAVSVPAAREYEEKRAVLINHVNNTMEKSPERSSLFGFNPLQVVFDNHTNHAAFMCNVLQLGLYEMMARVIPWVYGSYHARGFSFDYFLLEMKAWIEAIQENLQESHAREVVAVYEWLLKHHDQFVELALEEGQLQEGAERLLHGESLLFLNCLLQGDSRNCLKIAGKYVQKREDVMKLYLDVIQPAMYEVGRRWERGEVSVAQEHLASAIVARIMSSLYQDFVLGQQRWQRKAVVTAAPNEYHEMGAHMISDFLEMNGWDVYYLGANTPVTDLRALLLEKTPFLLAVSVTMPFNLKGVNEIIQLVRNEKNLAGMKIMIGGMVFNMESNLWKQLGADGWAADAGGALELAQKWYEEAEDNSVA